MHVIVYGYGRFGRVVTEEQRRHDMPVGVVESNPAREKQLSRLEVLHVNGTALEDEILEEAGIQSARAIVVATDSDSDNVYITLSAREKNPAIAIHARGES